MFGAKLAPEIQTALDRAEAMLGARYKLEKVAPGMWWVKHPEFSNLNAVMFPYLAERPGKPEWKLPVTGLYRDFESILSEPFSALKITEERKAQILAAAGVGQIKKLGESWIFTDTLLTELQFSEAAVMSFFDAFLAAAGRADEASEAL